MHGQPTPILVLKPRRRRPVVAFLVFLVLTIIGLFAAANTQSVGWLLALVGLLGSGFSAVVALSIYRFDLVLRQDGFSVAHLNGRRHYRWIDVGPFTAGRRPGLGLHMTADAVAFTLEPHDELTIPERRPPPLRYLPFNYGSTPARLADLMNEWRNRGRAASRALETSDSF